MHKNIKYLMIIGGTVIIVFIMITIMLFIPTNDLPETDNIPPSKVTGLSIIASRFLLLRSISRFCSSIERSVNMGCVTE